jgi:hypothetical protein
VFFIGVRHSEEEDDDKPMFFVSFERTPHIVRTNLLSKTALVILSLVIITTSGIGQISLICMRVFYAIPQDQWKIIDPAFIKQPAEFAVTRFKEW